MKFTGDMDVDRISALFREALNSFMGRRKSPLSAQMFLDLFGRFPVSENTRLVQVNGETTSSLTKTNACCVCFPDFMCEPVGHSSAAHHNWSQSASTGRDFFNFHLKFWPENEAQEGDKLGVNTLVKERSNLGKETVVSTVVHQPGCCLCVF